MAQQPLVDWGHLIFEDTHWHFTTFGRTLLDQWSARSRDLYLTTHNIHKRQIPMPTAEYVPIVLTRERPQIHALDSTAAGIGDYFRLTD